MERKSKFRMRRTRENSPIRIISASFAILIFAGTVLFLLSASTNPGHSMNFLESLFTATSATCVTGLTLIDPFTTLTPFGQVVLILLIQLGGLGLVTITSFFLISFSKRVGLRSLLLAQMNSNAFSVNNTRSLVKTIVATTLSIELFGALILSFRLVPMFGSRGVWMAVFTAISAYCNAGFDIFGFRGPFSNMMTFNNDPVVLYTVMLLIILGGLGFIVFRDIITWRRGRHLMLHTKIVLTVTGILIFLGAVLFFASEYSNPKTIGEMTLFQKITNSLFQSVTTRTAGFASVDMGALNDMTKALMIIWMFIGAGPGSTGGGIKITTITVLIMTVVSALRSHEDTVIFHHRIDRKTVYKAITIVMLSIAVILISSSLVFFSSPTVNGIDGIFETVSAFATVGLTANTTLNVGTLGLYAIILTMFIGRIGPVSFALSLIVKGDKAPIGEVLPEGKIIVG